MLSNLKGKFVVVPDGIVSSFKRDDTSNWSCRGEYLAGAHLLAKFQQDWQDIHALSELNAKQAKIVDQQIEDIYMSVKHDLHTFRKLTHDVGNLTCLVNLAEKAVNAIGNVRALTEEVQHKIVELENLIEQEKQTRVMSDCIDSLASYRKEKLISLDALREKLAEDHDVRLKLIDEEREIIMRKNFELAEKRFLEELHAYKETGILPKRDITGNKLLSIEDIELEENLDSLKEYLGE